MLQKPFQHPGARATVTVSRADSRREPGGARPSGAWSRVRTAGPCGLREGVPPAGRGGWVPAVGFAPHESLLYFAGMVRTIAPTHVGQILVPVADLARATAFYRDVVGLRFLFEVPTMAFFECGGVRLMLGVRQPDATDATGTIIYYSVDDLTAVTDALTGRGVVCVSPPHLVAPMPTHDLWMAFFRDSEENVFALMADVPRAAT